MISDPNLKMRPRGRHVKKRSNLMNNYCFLFCFFKTNPSADAKRRKNLEWPYSLSMRQKLIKLHISVENYFHYLLYNGKNIFFVIVWLFVSKHFECKWSYCFHLWSSNINMHVHVYVFWQLYTIWEVFLTLELVDEIQLTSVYW